VEEILGQLLEAVAVAIHAAVGCLKPCLKKLLELAKQSLSPEVAEGQRKQAGGSGDGQLHQGGGVNAEAECSVAPPMEITELRFAVVHRSHQFAEIEGLLQGVVAQFVRWIGHGAVAAVVLPGAMLIV